MSFGIEIDGSAIHQNFLVPPAFHVHRVVKCTHDLEIRSYVTMSSNSTPQPQQNDNSSAANASDLRPEGQLSAAGEENIQQLSPNLQDGNLRNGFINHLQAIPNNAENRAEEDNQGQLSDSDDGNLSEGELVYEERSDHEGDADDDDEDDLYWRELNDDSGTGK